MTPSAPLFSRDFSLWLGARFCSHMARKTAGVALAWQVYRLSGGDPLALGFIGLAEALPFLAAALWAGHLVDRRGHRRYLVGAEGILLLCAAALWALTFLPRVPLAALYAAAALAGVGVSFSTVASSAFVQRLVPKAEFSRAAAWNLGMFTSAVVVGPLLGGWILSAASARWAYAAAAGFSLAAWILSAALRGLPAAAAPAAATWQGIKEGVRFIRSQPLILACMSLDMVAVFFGDAVALFPIFADRLGAGPMGFGLLRASPAAGAAAVSLWQAARPFLRPGWGGLKAAVLAFGVAMIGFALSPHLVPACLFLALAGAADGASVIIRQTVYQARTPDALRGRVAALGGIFISASNELGAFESGVAARLMGAVPSVIFGGCAALLSVAAMDKVFEGKIRRAEPLPEPSAGGARPRDFV